MSQIVKILDIGQIQGKSFQKIILMKWVEIKSNSMRSNFHVN